MSDTTTTIIAIAAGAVLLFVFPLMAMSDRTDDMSQMAVQASVTKFVDDVRTTGVITEESYDKLEKEISSTGNAMELEIEAQIADSTPGKKSVQTDPNKIGNNVSYSLYTSQILEKLHNDGRFTLKEGDFILVKARNTNLTISQQLKNWAYKTMGNDTYSIAAQHSGIVTVTGSSSN